jgi:glucose-1-phosphate cytidylyltransferase
LEDDNTIWEQGPLRQLADRGQLMAYVHHGFWQPMDTLNDKQTLENMWVSNKAPWKKWE